MNVSSATPPNQPLRRALLSVSDKTDLSAFAHALDAAGFEIVSTGGTARALREAQLTVRDVSEVTGFPEMMDGRVKTLHPHVHAGILARRDVPADLEALAARGIAPIDVVVVNLYPFAETVARGAAFEETVEQIDIGGPSLLRAAAKNHPHVFVVCDAADYGRVAAALATPDDANARALKRALAAKAFAHTAAYDAAIAAHLGKHAGEEAHPERFSLPLRRARALRYGENPHQTAALYALTLPGEEAGIPGAQVLQGKELSFNNILDLDAAQALACELPDPSAVVVKHTNPCGVACGDSLVVAYLTARNADPVSAFGGIVALTREVDAETARTLAETFLEVVVAPAYSQEALQILARKPNLRVVAMNTRAPRRGLDVRSVRGGLLIQTADRPVAEDGAWRVVTTRAPTATESTALALAWTVVKHVKSNAIVFANEHRTLGIGAGQTSRVDAVQMACTKATHLGATLSGSVLGSDAFFPFADGLIAAAEAGATAIVQPGGSMRDEEVIAEANARGMAMVFTGARHFRH